MNKDYHSVILSRAKNLENNSVCIQILHYVRILIIHFYFDTPSPGERLEGPG